MSRKSPALIVLAACLLLSGAAASAPPENLPAQVAPCSIARQTGALDTYAITAGRSEGYQIGDRVRIVRNGRLVGDAVVVSSHGSSATILLTGKVASPPQSGDRVEFVRHRKPLPSILSQPSGIPGPPGVGTSPQSSQLASGDWKEVGSVPGLIGDDWLTRDTRTCHAWVRKQDLPYVTDVVDHLDESAQVNETYMGFPPPAPMSFYFCSLHDPGHLQPKFAARLARRTRFAGIALSGLNTCIINLGNWRTAEHYEPWDVEKTCRHEMNHLFAFVIRGADRRRTWEWLYESLAHTIEDTARPASVRLTLASMRSYMQGYSAADASFSALIQDRNNDELEQFRQYDHLLISIIVYLQEQYGGSVVARLMQSARGRDIEDAFIAVTGKGVQDVEKDWKAFYGIH